MSIASFIRNTVSSSKEDQTRRRKERLNREYEEMAKERKHLGDIAKDVARNKAIEKDVSNLKDYTGNRGGTGESGLMRFGRNLAKTMDEQKNNPNRRGLSDVKPKLEKKHSNKLRNELRTGVKTSSIFSGSSGFSIVGSGETNERYKPKNKSPFA